MHENCLWIGPLASQFCYGKQEIIETVMRQKRGVPKIYLESQEFVCGAQDRHGCIIIGKYIAVTDTNSKELFRNMQRATFVWKVIDNELCIMHIHISTPRGLDNEGKNFPHKLGKYTKDYLNMLIKKEVEKSGNVTVKDFQNIHHIIQVNDIICCEAYDTNVIIHTINGDIYGRIMLSTLEKKLILADEKMFIRAHKSFLVNRYYVKTIQRYEFGLTKGIKVPISKKRYLDIKDRLHF